MELNAESNNKVGGQSDIFTETIPKYGRVAMLFYIPDEVSNREEIIKQIRLNGGNTVKFHECFTYQLGIPGKVNNSWYYQGNVYSVQWIYDSVSNGKLLNNSEFKITQCDSGLEFPFSKKKIQYTVREIILIYQWITGK